MTVATAQSLPGVFPVTEYGAVGDGTHNDTGALQAAIEACTEAGGGQVLVTVGTYRTGTLYLRDNVELHLMTGATLHGSPDKAEYNIDDVYPENEVFRREDVSGAHLIIGHRVRNIAITGNGTIDANSAAFFDALPPSEQPDTYRAPGRMFAIKDWRPAQMIWLCRCRDVAIRDVALRNATYWTLLMLGCEDVHVRGLTVTNPPQTPNGDGIGIDCCRNVTVSDCNVYTGDDCITLRANTRVLGEDIPCENVVVSNCILSTPANCIRVGVGDGTIRDCQLNNLVLANSRVGINMEAWFPGPWTQGASIENITFSNFNIDAILALQVLHGAEAKSPGGLHHINFNNFRVRVTAGAYVGGNVDNYAEDIGFRDWDIHLHDETIAPDFVDRVRFPEPSPEGCEGTDGERALPAGLYGRYVDGVHTRNVRIHRPPSLQRTWLRDVWFDRCRNVELLEQHDH